MYQFFINSEDAKVIDYLKFLTFLSKEEIEALEESNRNEPHLRKAHKALAHEVISFLRGEEAYESAVRISETFFGGDIRSLSEKELREGISDLPRFPLNEEITLSDALLKVGACSSKREARELINGSSITLNGVKEKDPNLLLSADRALAGNLFILRKGKKNYFVLERD